MSDDFFLDLDTMREVLAEFLPGRWVEHADFRTLEHVGGSGVYAYKRSRHRDSIWRLRVGGEWLYVGVLCKFAQPDRWLPLRAFARLGMLFQKMVMSRKLAPDGKFPPLLPIILYRDDREWIGTPDLMHYLPPTSQRLAALRGKSMAST